MLCCAVVVWRPFGADRDHPWMITGDMWRRGGVDLAAAAGRRASWEADGHTATLELVRLWDSRPREGAWRGTTALATGRLRRLQRRWRRRWRGRVLGFLRQRERGGGRLYV